MTLPGNELVHEDLRTPAGPQLAIATPFLVGDTEEGPDTPVALRDMRGLRNRFGARTTLSAAVHDWLEQYWRQGGGQVWLQRRLGPSPVKASVDFPASSGTSFTLRALYAGASYNDFAGDVDISGSDITFKVLRDGVLQQTFGPVQTVAALQALVADSGLPVEIVPGAGGAPTAGSVTSLAGGDDDLDSVTDTETGAAILKHLPERGPGVYVLPGITATSANLLAAAAAAAHPDRLVRPQVPNTATVADIVTALNAYRGSPHAGYIDPIVTWLVGPGLSPTSTRLFPGTLLRCACEARNDAAGITPNQPAAGRWGAPRYPELVPAVEFAADDRETINDAGGTLIRTINGETRLYGSRTAADPVTDPVALRLGSARLRMAFGEISRFEMEQTNFGEVDAGGVVLGELSGRIEAQARVWQRSLYDLDVTAQLVEDQPGQYLVEVLFEYAPAPDAERVRTVISRSLPDLTTEA